jgi:hypothetical protein
MLPVPDARLLSHLPELELSSALNEQSLKIR